MGGALKRGLWVLCLVGCVSAPPQAKVPTKEKPEGKATDDEVQELVLGFVDEYVQDVASTTNEMEERNRDPDVRFFLHRFKYSTAMAAYGIAGQDNPYVALIDLLVLVMLERIVSEDPHVSAHHGPRAAELSAALRKIETQMWDKSLRVFTKEQLNDLRALVMEWREANKEKKMVSFVRFADFAAYRRKSGTKRGGSLLGIKEASRAVDDVRLLTERAMHLVQHMPVLLGWQLELVVYDLARQPETRRLLTDTTELTASLTRVTDELEKLPDMIAKERADTLNDVAQKISEERAAALDDFATRIAAEREAFFLEIDKQHTGLRTTLTEVRAALADIDKLAGRAETILGKVDGTVRAVKETIEVTDRLAARFPQDPDAPESKPVPFESYIKALTELTNAAREFHKLVDTTDAFVASAAWDKRIADAREGVDFAFWRGVAMVVVVFAAGLVTALLYKKIAKTIT